jgi:predicted AAA+ superfamily ATPase
LPDLLDEIHYLIEKKGTHFLLTGSSARKLKAKGVNTLGGRARIQYFFPLTFGELKEKFKLETAINHGMLPSIYFSDDPVADLESYVALYLQQEVAYEGMVRNLPAFSRFMEIAAICHGEQIDYTSVSLDVEIPRTTIHDYFQILKDTLVGHELHVWGMSKKRKPIATPKFYFFDWGVAKHLMGYKLIEVKTPLFGKAFESFIFQELLAYTGYFHKTPLKYWRTKDQKEVDFILNDEIAIEVKAKSTVSKKDLEGLTPGFWNVDQCAISDK